MNRYVPLFLVLALAGCAKHVAPLDRTSLIGTWTEDKEPGGRIWSRWIFRADGTAEWRTHFQMGPEAGADMVMGGPYRLEGKRLTVNIHRFMTDTTHPDRTIIDGNIPAMTQGNIATFDDIRLEGGNLVFKNQKGGGETVLYPLRER